MDPVDPVWDPATGSRASAILLVSECEICLLVQVCSISRESLAGLQELAVSVRRLEDKLNLLAASSAASPSSSDLEVAAELAGRARGRRSRDPIGAATLEETQRPGIKPLRGAAGLIPGRKGTRRSPSPSHAARPPPESDIETDFKAIRLVSAPSHPFAAIRLLRG